MTVQFTPIPKIVTTFMKVSSEPSSSFLMITFSTTSPPCNAPRSNINNSTNTTNNKKLYAQALKINLSSNIEDVFHIKEAFPTLSANKVVEIIKITNNNISNKKPKINMTTKELLRKQIMVSINETNTKFIINSAHLHIADFIHSKLGHESYQEIS